MGKQEFSKYSFLKWLSHPDSVARSMAIKDLMVSDHPDKLELLRSLVQRESNLKNSYAIKKFLHTRKAQSASNRGADFQQSQTVILEALKDPDEERQLLALRYMLKHKLVEFLPEALENCGETENKEIVLALIRIISWKPETNFRQLYGYLALQKPEITCAILKVLFDLGMD